MNEELLKDGLLRALAGAIAGLVICMMFCILYWTGVLEGATYSIPLYLITGTLNGAVIMGATIFYDIESWSILRCTVTHFVLTIIVFYTFGFVSGWMKFDNAFFWIFTVMFVAMYFMIWLVMYLSYRRQVRRMNEELREMKKTRKGKKMSDISEKVKKNREEWGKADAKRDEGLREPENIKKFKDISYGPHGDYNLMDIYRPTQSGDAKLPVIVSIHGGGYFYGDKELYRFYCMRFAQDGFAVVNFNYRLVPEFTFPAPLEDICAVFGWMKENSEAYGLDLNNVFLVGDSAGAQMASQFAAMCTNAGYAENFGFNIPGGIKIRAIALACGFYSLKVREETDEFLADYLGEVDRENDPRLEVLGNINADYPPTFAFTAYNDFLVEECMPFVEFLKEKGIEAEGRIFGTKEEVNIGHVFHVDMKLAEGEKANKAQIEFFKKHINGGGN